MAKEIRMTTYVHPKGICPVRGVCEVSTPGSEGSSTTENRVDIFFDLRNYIYSVYRHFHLIQTYASSVFYTADQLENKMLGSSYAWISKYIQWISGSRYFSDDNLRYKIWKDTEDSIKSLRENYEKYCENSASLYKNIFNYEITQLENLYNKAQEEALRVQVVVYVTDEEHDIVEDDEYENITGNIMQALPRLGAEVFKIGMFPKAESSDNERDITAYVTNKTYFDDLDCSIEMIYTTEESSLFGENERIPSLIVRMEFPPEENKCGEMYEYWFSVEPKPFYRLNFKVIGGSVTAHKILILGGRKFQYAWRRSFRAAPIPGITTSSLIIQNYFGDVLYYVVDTAEEE